MARLQEYCYYIIYFDALIYTTHVDPCSLLEIVHASANLDELDFDTTLKLIKKRQALQKQLSLLEYEEQENDQDSFTKSRVLK